MTRTFTQTITQSEGKGFENIGDAFEGTYQRTKVVKLTDPKGQPREGHLLMLKPDGDAPAFGVWANAVLMDLMAEVTEGQYVRITFTGEGKKQKGKNPAKMFKVEIADGQ